MGGAARRVWGLVALLFLLTLAASLLAIRAAGASTAMLAMQGAAGVIAAALVFLMSANRSALSSGAQVTVMALSLFAVAGTALFGVSMDGATRWIGVGPVLLHTASLVLPAAVWAFAMRPASLLTAGLCAAIAVTLAVQRDGGAAVAFALAVVACLWGHRSRLDWASAAVAVVAAAWAWTRPDSLPAVSYVEEVVSAAFATAPSVGVFAGLMLALLPAPFFFFGLKHDSAAALALGALWGGFVLAGIFGNYPTPVIGYGASPVLGWGVSLGLALAHMSRARVQERP